jgi:hypothetical protein
MEQFLAQVLVPPAVTVDHLDAFAQAWNRHDIDALMSFMADDCVFHAWTGPDASGTRHIGRDAVRAAYQKAWTDFPDAQWTRARHVVTGARGLSEWTFVGTRASDGQRVEVDGCDQLHLPGRQDPREGLLAQVSRTVTCAGRPGRHRSRTGLTDHRPGAAG